MVGHSPTPRRTGTQPVYNRSPERSRPRIAAMESGPGPGRYRLPGSTGVNNHDPSKKKNPAYSFGTRTKQFSCTGVNSCSPGPVYFVSPNVTRTGKDGAPMYSLHTRTKASEVQKGPGPAAYHVGKISPLRESKAPAYTFGLKLGSSKVSAGNPSPNKYQLPSLVGSNVISKKSPPAYSMTGRSRIGSFHEDLSKTPGPGTYSVINPQVYGQKSPAYSLHARCPPPSDNCKKPGPGSHSPEKAVCSHRQAPAYSFGVRHSEYIASYLNIVV